MKHFYTDWDEFKDAQLCNAWVATAIVGSAAIGAGAQIFGAKTAANAQKNAAAQAAAVQQAQYQQTRTDLAPYRELGEAASGRLTANDFYTAPIVMDQEALEKTPGYQFTKTQGLKAVGNSAAARGLGVSGAALKGAANFATGLADNTYKTQFDIANTNQTNAFNRLKSVMDLGETAATGTGVLGEKAAYNTGTAITAGGNAGAAGANATGGAIANFANSVGGYTAYRGLYGNNGSGGPVSSVPSPNNALYTGDPSIPGFVQQASL